MGFRVSALGFKVSALGFRDFRVSASGFGAGLRIRGLMFMSLGLTCFGAVDYHNIVSVVTIKYYIYIYIFTTIYYTL